MFDKLNIISIPDSQQLISICSSCYFFLSVTCFGNAFRKAFYFDYYTSGHVNNDDF